MPTKNRKIKTPDSLVVVAHPDDETIFFAGLLLTKKYRWQVLCVTDGNADGLGAQRQKQFLRACHLMGVKTAGFLNFQDVFEQRLDVQALANELSKLTGIKRVFTHGVLGEYGHPHHQDVSYAVHQAFKGRSPVYSVAYNMLPELRVVLPPKVYRTKAKILWQVYSGEIRRFVNYLPASWAEGFVRVSDKEVHALYQWIACNEKPDFSKIKTYKWLIPYLEQGGGNLKVRPF